MTISEITYQGNKTRLMKILKPLIEDNLEEGMVYIEPFGGGMNSFTPINSTKKIANDVNEYNIALWRELKSKGFDGVENDWRPFLETLSNCEDKPDGENFLKAKALYLDMKLDCLSNGNKYPKALLGFVAYSCSFGGSWWNGFAGYNEKRGENYIKEAIAALRKQVTSTVNIENSDFLHGSYDSIDIPDNAFIYCDPPYAETKKYANSFDNEMFWQWCRDLISTKENIKILISEYNAPSDFICIWSRQVQDKMGKNTMSKNEKLFIHNSQVSKFNLSSLPETVAISRNDIMEMVKTSLNRILSENMQDEIITYHGTLAKFDKFNHKEFAGTGEGSARYGEGVYLTNVRDTGLHYTATICGQKYGKEIIKDYKQLMDKIAFIERFIKSKLDKIKRNKEKGINTDYNEEQLKDIHKKNFPYWRDILLSLLKDEWFEFPEFWGNKRPFNFPSSKKLGERLAPIFKKMNSWDEFHSWIVDLRESLVKNYQRYLLTIDIPDDGYINWDNSDMEFILKMRDLMQKYFDSNGSGIKLPRVRKVKNFGEMFDNFKKDGISSYDLTKAVEFSGLFPDKPVVGFIVPTGYGRGGDGRGLNYIIFDDKNVKILKRENLKNGEITNIN